MDIAEIGKIVLSKEELQRLNELNGKYFKEVITKHEADELLKLYRKVFDAKERVVVRGRIDKIGKAIIELHNERKELLGRLAEIENEIS